MEVEHNKESDQSTPSESQSAASQQPEQLVFMPWRTGAKMGVVIVLPLLLAKYGFGGFQNRYFLWIEFALALPVLGIVGAQIYHSGWEKAKHFSYNTDTWVSICVLCLVLYSIWVLTLGGVGLPLMAEAAALVTWLSFRRAKKVS